jgi:hypothetical protein
VQALGIVTISYFSAKGSKRGRISSKAPPSALYSRKIESEHPGLRKLASSDLDSGDGKLSVIRRWLGEGGLAPDSIFEVLEQLKEKLFDDLKPSQIEEEYFSMLRALGKKLR